MFKILFIFSFLFIQNTLAQTLEIHHLNHYETNSYMEYASAKSLEETPFQLKNRIWKKEKKSANILKYSTKAYWAKIKVTNSANETQTYYLKAENQFTYKVDFYFLKNEQLLSHIEDGVISKNPNRVFNTNHIIFPIELKAHEEADIYLKIRNYNKITINFSLVNKEYMLNYYQTYNLLEGIFFGGMLLMLLYNLFLYFLLGIRAYIYYVGYVFWLAVYFLGFFGFSQRYFEAYHYLFYISSGAFFVFLTLFVQSILNLKTKLPKVHKAFNFFILYFISTTLINIYMLEIELFFYAQLLFNILFIFIFFYVLLIISSTYYLAYVKDDTIAKFYSIIWSVMALMGLLIPLQYLNIISLALPSNYILQFIILVEALFFSFILAYKINLIEHEKRKQEQLLVQQTKLASMGEVIAMIAHQWRQPLAEINGTILNMDIDYQKKELVSKKFNDYLDSIENTTAYMSQTINDFTDYFKHNKRLETFSVSDLIKGSLNLISSSNKKNIHISYIKHPKILLTSYRSELIQSLLIMLNNAIDACNLQSEYQKSKIFILVDDTPSHIIITVADTGGGISEDIIEKIYDPYFTTKHKSKGTGLGLYILKMIIEQTIQGKIKISSSQEATKCSIFIPKNVTSKNTF